MLPVGYMYKRVSPKPDWLKTDVVEDIYSLSGCVSEDFYGWERNGYGLYDSPQIMEGIANRKSIDLSEMKLFFYKVTDKQWNANEQKWDEYQLEKFFKTEVQLPKETKLEGYDVGSFFDNSRCECSPLSCNHLAEFVTVNDHCLLKSYEEALDLTKSGELKDCTPGPYRIFEVHSIVIV